MVYIIDMGHGNVVIDNTVLHLHTRFAQYNIYIRCIVTTQSSTRYGYETFVPLSMSRYHLRVYEQ